MAWQKTGYQDSVEYDPDRHVVRYGTYEFHGKELGINRDAYTIDPSKVKDISDVYLALGADPTRISAINAANRLYGSAFSGGVGQAQPFAGKEAWKNSAAQELYRAIRPPERNTSAMNIPERTSAWTDIGGIQFRDPSKDRNMSGRNQPLNQDPVRALYTQKLPDGMMQVTAADPIPDTYDFVDRISSMANALSAGSGGDLGNQRPRRRTASGAF